MAHGDILLSLHSVSKDSLVRLSDVHTGDTKKLLEKKGYKVPYTILEFQERYKRLPAECFFYFPSPIAYVIYFNENTYAIANMSFLCDTNTSDFEKKTLEIIDRVENEVKAGDFGTSLSSLPNSLTWEFFSEILNKKLIVQDIYSLFLELFQRNDFGFSGLTPELLSKIMSCKTVLQREKTASKLEDFPQKIKVYRGGNSASTPYSQAFSWTTDIRVANFFAVRHGNGPGYLVEGYAEKSDVLEYLTERGENEILVMPGKVIVNSEIRLKGIDYLQDSLNRVTPLFLVIKSKLQRLNFTRESEIHGRMHELRVALLALLIADSLKLSLPMRYQLATAAIFHDTRRTGDGEDTAHGFMARSYYESETSDSDPIISFLCEYHSRPDQDGYIEIQRNPILRKQEKDVVLLYNVFKDADALDRVRFGFRDTNVNKLRLSESKTLTIIARLVYDGLKE